MDKAESRDSGFASGMAVICQLTPALTSCGDPLTLPDGPVPERLSCGKMHMLFHASLPIFSQNQSVMINDSICFGLHALGHTLPRMGPPMLNHNLDRTGTAALKWQWHHLEPKIALMAPR